MKIRDATQSDLLEILNINQASVPHVGDIGMERMEYFLKHANPFLVIEEEDEIAGFMIVLEPGLNYSSLNYSFFCNNYTEFDYVDRIAIAESHRRKNLGSALYERLFEQTDKPLVACEVNLVPPNPDSLKFHKSLDFKKVAEQKTNGGEKCVAMLIKELRK